MYLLQLNPFTGLIKEDDELDGWMAIASFRDLVSKEGYGIEALTCVALVIDYGSVIKNYSEKERPLRAMEDVFNNRKALNWNCDEIQLACINYKELQYNATLEEKALLDELRITKLNEIKEADSTYKKTVLLKELSGINDLHDSFDKKNAAKDTFAESPVRNGYKLLRLEIKVTDQKSFYYERAKREQEQRDREQEANKSKVASDSAKESKGNGTGETGKSIKAGSSENTGNAKTGTGSEGGSPKGIQGPPKPSAPPGPPSN